MATSSNSGAVAETEPSRQPATAVGEGTVFAVLAALSVSHMLNDIMQSLIPAVYPLLKEQYHLTFTQVGLITFTFQLTASLLQPLIGLSTDRKPRPYSLATGMVFTLVGLILLSMAHHFVLILIAAALVGIGSSVFHPEASRVARMASGGRHGFAQSLFQVGGNAGSAIGPLLAAFIVVPWGQASIACFSIAAVVAMVVLFAVGRWYEAYLHARKSGRLSAAHDSHRTGPSRARVISAIVILLLLIFSKYFYLASLSSYYTFYLIDRFGVSIPTAQIYLFIFLGSVAAGTIAGGPVGDRIGFKAVIWVSILGVLPFTLVLPYANLFWTGVLTVPIGVILASAFSAIMVYAQELMPSRVGLVAGLFFGFAFGMGGLGAAVLGWLADKTNIQFVYRVCSFLPLVGLLAGFLPNLEKKRAHA
ncbi:MFS transporter, FSR family, fosmidomycin resistance protein [Singulisphaera sp. GP187]|uniref:MFS transporter n=1 Tax=Singulisphaera sp. GP187 TaxID=1882752 RepID=UPI00092B1B88|nr:MFS transporter [Singulisphaera sp. GP187]SIO58208.1 MFS transporter, FSR family, fosmidomycin resistance protein [Singulisphaera sp. GP187]